MPKVTLDKNAQSKARARAAIARHMELQGLDDTSLAKRMGVTTRTIANRKKEPGTMGLKDLWEMSRVLKCSIAELCGDELPEERFEKLIISMGRGLKG